MMDYFRKVFLHSPGHYIAALIVAVVVGVYRFATLSDGVGVWFALYEIFSVSGLVTFLIGGLMTVSFFGAFDLFGYVFSSARSNGKYKNYADYSQKSMEKRTLGKYYFVPYYVVGVIVFLISFLFS